MVLNPYLNGAIAAQERMADALRDAEVRRLVRSVEADGSAPRGWLRRLLGLGRRAPYRPTFVTDVPRLRPTRTAHSAKF